jgi:hypothetical protein
MLSSSTSDDGDRFLAGYEGRAASSFAPGPIVRLLARVRGSSLDRALIDGADPSSSPRLAARAARLSSSATRNGIAAGLERMLGEADAATSRWATLPHPRALAANATEISELAQILRGPVPLYARGLAMLRALVTDGTSAAYTDRAGSSLALALRSVRVAIRG